jgi:hypothetical protein
MRTNEQQARLAATARDRLGGTYDRLERASHVNHLFRELLDRIMHGTQRTLTKAEYTMLDVHEARYG